MKCPACGFLDDKVVDSRAVKDGAGVRRRRVCLNCSHRFSPKFKAYLFARHMHTNRSFKCPKCGKRNMCKRKLSYFDD